MPDADPFSVKELSPAEIDRAIGNRRIIKFMPCPRCRHTGWEEVYPPGHYKCVNCGHDTRSCEVRRFWEGSLLAYREMKVIS